MTEAPRVVTASVVVVRRLRAVAASCERHRALHDRPIARLLLPNLVSRVGQAAHRDRHARDQLVGGEVVLALVIALIGVLVMVQSGQAVSIDIHLPQALTGLVILAVATSLPNTVVAVSLATDPPDDLHVNDLTMQTVTTNVVAQQELALGRRGNVIASVVLAAIIGVLWIVFR